MSDLFERIESALKDLEALDPRERDDHIAKLREQDPEFAQLLVDMREQWDRAGTFLETPALSRKFNVQDVFDEERAREERRKVSLIGTVLGDFVIEREIARGGMGVVYRAQQKPLERPVALKVFTALPGDTEGTPQFVKEAQAVAGLQHDGILEVYNVGKEGEHSYFAMELVEGASLDEVLDAQSREASLRDLKARNGQGLPDLGAALHACLERRFGPQRWEEEQRRRWNRPYHELVCRIVLQVAAALHHAHTHGIIHRDVKPSNILLRADGRVFLTDFGVASLTEGSSRTRTGRFAGTPYYVSPERVAGKRADPRSDVFSLGVSFFELLTGSRPFEGENPHAILNQIASRALAPSVRRTGANVPRDLETIVATALEKDPARRYASAAKLRDDIERFLRYEPVEARPLGPLNLGCRWVLSHKTLTCAIVLPLLLLVSFAVWQTNMTGILNEARTAGAKEAQSAKVAKAKRASSLGRLAVLRGEWDEAVRYFDESLSFEPEDSMEIHIERVRARIQNLEDDEIYDEIADLRNLPHADEHRAKIWLLEGLFRVERLDESESSLAQIEKALDLAEAEPDRQWLSEGELAYARAILAPDIVALERALEETIRHDPFQHAARRALVISLLLLGKMERALDHVRVFRTLFPSDPTGVFLECVCALMRPQTRASADSLIDELESGEFTTLSTACRQIQALGSELDDFGESWLRVLLDEAEDSSWKATLELATKLIQPVWTMATYRTRQGPGRIHNLTVPPAMELILEEFVAITTRFMTGGFGREEALRQLSRLGTYFPVGLVFFVQGMAHWNSGELVEAAHRFEFARRLPSPIDLGQAPLYYLLTVQISSIIEAVEEQDKSREARARASATHCLEAFLEQDLGASSRWQFVFEGALALDELELAHELTLRWARSLPDDPMACLAQARIAWERGAHRLAWLKAQDALDVDEENVEARKLMDWASKKLK